MDKLHKIYSDIKEVKIQGATNIAKAALEAYYLKPDDENRKMLLSLRPTEPMLLNVLNLIDKLPKEKIIEHFSEAQEKINGEVNSKIRNGMIIFTHCRSTNVIKALIAAKKNGKQFVVYNTETRPLYQGRMAAKELAKEGIDVTNFPDSGMLEAIKKSDIVLIGADAILGDGVINKIGSGAIAELAHNHKKNLYVVADSWKFSPKFVKIEERNFHEVWNNAPKHVKVRNPAFEKVGKKYIKAIISEYGVLKYEDFIKKVEE